jgi:hypothetical protein
MMLEESPRDLDDKLVKAFTKALRATHNTLYKHESESHLHGCDRRKPYTMFDKVGIWCTHLRSQLWSLGAASRSHAEIVKRLCDKNMWDDVAVPKKHFEKWKHGRGQMSYGSTAYFETRRVVQIPNNWSHQVSTPKGGWEMSNAKLDSLLDQSMRSTDYTQAVTIDSQAISRGLNDLEFGPIRDMVALLEESKGINEESDKVVAELCTVVEQLSE